MWKHFIAVFLICAAAVLVYAGVTRAYFCSYDDFVEMHRAAFEDTQDPTRVFTTSHFNSAKYRPLNRLVILWTYWASDGEPVYFRVRNLAFHLINIALVYALGALLFGSMPVSAAGAALFGLHPLANQPIIGAVWTNTMAYSGFLLALVLFIGAVCAERRFIRLTLALFTGWLALLAYDSNVVVFPLMALYWLLNFSAFPSRASAWRFMAAFSAIAGAFMAAYFALRIIFISDGWSQAASTIPTPQIVAKNIVVYLAALLSPLDPVFANAWLKAPLPSENVFNNLTLVIFALPVLLLVLGLAMGIRYALKRSSASIRTIDWPAVGFLAAGIILPLLPVLLLQAHPSETYLYLPVAFYALLLAYAVSQALGALPARRQQRVYTAVIISFVALYAAGTWTRNGRVVRCAATAEQIIRGLPEELSRGGRWTVTIATAPEPGASRPYGFYAYRGIQTIGLDDEAVTAALQLLYRNPALAGELVEPDQLAGRCRDNPARHVCLLVYADGRVESLGSGMPRGKSREQISSRQILRYTALRAV